MRLTRRQFLVSTAALSAGCAVCADAATPTGAGDAKVRDPAVGQSWSYAKRDAIKRSIVDKEVDRVSKVGQTIELESHSELGNDTAPIYPSWASPWLQACGFHPPDGRFPSEVQAPWGMVLVDPHWAELQVYKQPIPLWPKELQPGWSMNVFTEYVTPGSSDALPWQLTMRAHNWESITVPAGRFKALRYTNIIDFRFTNASERDAAQRLETLWFAPEIGRWVVRESSGNFRESLGTEVLEGSYRWELLAWT